MTAELQVNLEPKVIENETYAIITKLKFVFNAPNGRVKVKFGRDKALSDLVGQIADQYYSVAAHELTPHISNIMRKMFKNIGNGFMSMFTEKQLFP